MIRGRKGNVNPGNQAFFIGENMKRIRNLVPGMSQADHDPAHSEKNDIPSLGLVREHQRKWIEGEKGLFLRIGRGERA